MSLVDVSENAKKYIKIGAVILFVVLGAIFGGDMKGLICDCPVEVAAEK